MFTKFASFEVSDILEVKGSESQIKQASLSRVSDYSDFRTKDGYLYARIRAISSRVNKNHDGWPSVELAGGPEVFERHTASEGFTVEANKDAKYGYSTFLGKPIFVDHHNSDPGRARGVIVDSKLHVEDYKTASLDPYYASAPDNHCPPTWVELLLEVDAKSFPRLAKAIIEGSKDPNKGIDGFSMGCNVEKSVCNICKNAATSPDEYCNHVRMKGAEFDYIDPKSGKKISKKSYEDCHGIQFFEISAVFDPADETALLRELIQDEGKTASTKVALDEPEFAEGYQSGEMKCPNCSGMGHRDGNVCPACGGIGWMSGPKGGDGAYAPQQLNPGHIPFGPADEIDFPMEPRRQGSTESMPAKHASMHTADNPLPQADLIKAPQEVDTLRKEMTCPVCGSTMDDGATCEVCGYVEPPEHFNNPDLTQSNQPVAPMMDDGKDAPSANIPQPLAHVTNDMARWTLSVHPKAAGRINPVERPILPGQGPVSNEPKDELVLEDHDKPVTSAMRTARQLIAATKRAKENNMENKVAADTVPAAKPDTNVDVVGVGGVMDDSNESASKADAQVDVLAQGGTGVENVSAEQENVNVEQGNEHSKNVEAIPTMTWSEGKGDSLGQHDPVSSEPFPASDEGVKKSHDANAFPSDSGFSGGGAATGNKPVAEQFGERVDVTQPVTSPANNSGPTKTWSGTDGNGVNKQQDPVTNETLEGSEGVKKAHIFRAFKLADLEVEMGLITPDQKYARAAELEAETLEVVSASLRYAQRVKTAGLAKQTRTAKRLPSLTQSPTVTKEASVDQSFDDDSSLFF